MSPRLTNVSSRKAHRALIRLGFQDSHCTGTHQTMVRMNAGGRPDVLVLVLGKSEIRPFTMKGILDQGHVTVEDFIAAL